MILSHLKLNLKFEKWSLKSLKLKILTLSHMNQCNQQFVAKITFIIIA